MSMNTYGDKHEIDFQLIADGRAAFDFYNSLQEAMRDGDSFPMGMNRLQDTEFKCIWCGSVNPITHKRCSQCGGPRGFIMGDNR